MIETQRVCISAHLKIDSVDMHTVAEQILELFPLQDVPESISEDSDQEGTADRLKQVQQHSIVLKSKPVKENDEEDVTRLGEYYRRYRTVEELPKETRAFYESSGEL